MDEKREGRSETGERKDEADGKQETGWRNFE